MATGIAINGKTPTFERFESLEYGPGFPLPSSGDLEAGTKTITATAEAVGLASADYSTTLKVLKPEDDRIKVLRIACRLAVTIDTIPTGDTNLYCRVYVDSQDADHLLFDEDWTTIGEKLDAVDTHSEGKSTIFDLLKDGSEHTFYFFFWKAGTGTGIVISAVELWEGVGTCDTASRTVLSLTHRGFVFFGGAPDRNVGTGSPNIVINPEPDKGAGMGEQFCEPHFKLMLLNGLHYLGMWGTVPTDLNYIRKFIVTLRSMQ